MELGQLLTGILLMVVMVCHASDIFLDFSCTSDDSPLTDFRLSGTDKLRTNMADQYETYRFVPADGRPADGNAMIRVTSSVSGFFVRIQAIKSTARIESQLHCTFVSMF